MNGRAFTASGVGALLVALATLGAPTAVAAPPALSWNPPSYDFDPVAYGTGPSEPKEFTLTNTSGSRVVIQNWRYRYASFWPETGDPFWSPEVNASATPCVGGGQALEPGGNCSIELVFDPLHPGNWWSQVRVRGEGEELWTELTVTGEGTGPWVPMTPGHLAFGAGTVGTATAPQTIVVEDQHPTELRIESISITGPTDGAEALSPDPFRIVGGSCRAGGSVALGKTCTIEVLMDPTQPGDFQSNLQISDSAPDSPQTVELEGSAPAAPSTDEPADDEGTVSVNLPTTTAPSMTPAPGLVRRACPKGKRRAISKGHRICVKKHRSPRGSHRAHGKVARRHADNT